MSSFCPDPTYISGPAMKLRERMIETYGLHIEAMDDLAVRSFSNVKSGLLGVRSGLQFETFHWVLCQTVGQQLIDRYGPPIAPATVIPLQRRLRTVYDRFGTR